jgi:hypothetical protein
MLQSTVDKTSSMITTPTTAEMEEGSNNKSSNRIAKKSSSVTNITRPSSPRQFFARLYGNLEASSPSSSVPEIAR